MKNENRVESFSVGDSLKELSQKNTDSVSDLLHSTALVNHTLMNSLAQHTRKMIVSDEA